MITWVDVLAVAVAVGLAVLGLWRGFLKEILVSLAGVVLGVLLGNLWADRWAGDLAARLGGDPWAYLGWIRLFSLVFVVLFIGYGSSLFLPRRPITVWQRLAGAGIGLLNGLFLCAFGFSFVQQYLLGNPPPDQSLLETSTVSSILIKWLPWIFLVIAALLSLVVVIVALIRFGRYIGGLVQPPAPAVPPGAAVISAPSSVSFPPAPVSPPLESTAPCPNCGQAVPLGAAFCPNCGKIIS